MQIDPTEALAWDVANWSAALRFWEREGELDRQQLDCLEIGAHGGGLSVWLAQAGHLVVCSDLEDVHAKAAPLVRRFDLQDRIRFQDIDATDIPYENAFDIVLFKSVLGGVGRDGAIERQRAAIEAMHRALRPGGRLLFAENLIGSNLHRWLRGRYVAWGASWRYVTVDEMCAFLRPFETVRYDTAGFFGAFGRSEAQRRILSSVDRTAMNKFVPPSWRYIIYGVATKSG